MMSDRMQVHFQCICRKISGCPDSVPMGLLNEEWAQKGHDQTLERLNERGGLSVFEILAIIQRRKYQSMEPEKALTILIHILTGYEICESQKDHLNRDLKI
jgi:hypothetical protein